MLVADEFELQVAGKSPHFRRHIEALGGSLGAQNGHHDFIDDFHHGLAARRIGG